MPKENETDKKIEEQQSILPVSDDSESNYSLDDLFDEKSDSTTIGNIIIDYIFKHWKPLLLVLGVAIICSIILFLLFSSRFRIKKITVTGNYVLSDEDIMNMIGVKYGDHIYKGVNGNVLDIICLDYGKTEDEIISRYPYVEDIKIHAEFPSEISVTVKERAKVACIRLTDGYATVDTNGTVVELCLSNDDLEKYNPVICGLEINHVMLGERIEIANEEDFQKAVIILGAVLAADVNNTFEDNYSFYDSLQEIRIIPSGMIYLTFKLPSDSLLQVKLKSVESINDDMNWLVSRVRAHTFEDFPNGALDMTGEEYIYHEY